MTKYFEKIVNIKTGEEVLRPLNQDEVAVIDEAALAAEEVAKTIAEKQASDAEAKAVILNRLGITEEEAEILFRAR